MINSGMRYPYPLYNSMYARGKGEKRRVAALARVSTQHEEQLKALRNQEKWLCDLIDAHEDWEFDPSKDLYIDEGKSGTTRKNREGLKLMLERASAGQYDLIIIRELSRLMRYAKEALAIIDDLKKKNVEIFFAAEGISTFDNEKNFETILRAGLAQQESEKIGSRVKTGIKTAALNGKIVSGFNTYGYDYVQELQEENGKVVKNGRLVGNKEEADNVIRIFDMYIKGHSMKEIATALQADGVLGKNGNEVKWTATSVSHILHNPTYCGFREVGKTETMDSITHYRIKKDAKDVELVQSDFVEVIIPKEKWDEAQRICNEKTNRNMNTGKKQWYRLNKDVYCRLMRCECGRRFRKDNGRKDGMASYTCYSILNYGSVKVREKKGLPVEGVCTLPGIIDWKLDLYTKRVFERLEVNVEEIKESLRKSIMEGYEEGGLSIKKRSISKLKNKLVEVEKQINNTVELLTKNVELMDMFERKLHELKAEKERLEEEIKQREEMDGDTKSKEECMMMVENFLDTNLNLGGMRVPDVLLEAYINHIKVYNNNTFEYNIKIGNSQETLNMLEYNQDYSLRKRDAIFKIDNSDAIVLDEFTIEYDEAKQYANSLNRKVNRVRWQKATIRIVMNI